MEGFILPAHDILVQSADRLVFLGLQVYDVARMQLTAVRQVVVPQDLPQEKVIALGKGRIGLPFDGIDEGDAVPAV